MPSSAATFRARRGGRGGGREDRRAGGRGGRRRGRRQSRRDIKTCAVHVRSRWGSGRPRCEQAWRSSWLSPWPLHHHAAAAPLHFPCPVLLRCLPPGMCATQASCTSGAQARKCAHRRVVLAFWPYCRCQQTCMQGACAAALCLHLPATRPPPPLPRRLLLQHPRPAKGRRPWVGPGPAAGGAGAAGVAPAGAPPPAFCARCASYCATDTPRRISADRAQARAGCSGNRMPSCSPCMCIHLPARASMSAASDGQTHRLKGWQQVAHACPELAIVPSSPDRTFTLHGDAEDEPHGPPPDVPGQRTVHKARLPRKNTPKPLTWMAARSALLSFSFSLAALAASILALFCASKSAFRSALESSCHGVHTVSHHASESASVQGWRRLRAGARAHARVHTLVSAAGASASALASAPLASCDTRGDESDAKARRPARALARAWSPLRISSLPCHHGLLRAGETEGIPVRGRFD